MTPRQASRAADLFTGLVVASVAVALAGLTWHILGAGPADPPSATTAAAPAAAIDIGPALALAPFGRPDAASAQPTTLAIQLRGVILADPPSASSALIAPTGGRPVSYGVGQAVPGGATIEEIAFNRVLLRVNGRLERLDLPRISAGGEAPAAPPAMPSPPGAVPASGPSDGSGPQPMQAIAPPPAAPTGAEASSLLDGLGAAPVGGAYRIGADPSAAARRAGLLPGDLIERINGLPATAVTADRQLMAQVMAAGPAQIDVLRGGKRVSFSFSLR
ncbi:MULTISPECIES: type II secretion system protein N [unclassified Sphingomonas]|uniref:type II secretion system protein N n=1 Tax=unclassified Sphingomonas TaxID=196159 RepID=UPI0006FC4C10|nr:MULTISPECIES: type II secretion system protein N [unclassified Sphingomonas]KQX21654.1 signaling protein [Sphingomonas sp. Root1294]KQY72970.1 signaling protein [Sphingomonas sp. Root50]KRB88235.1 signaling protein [Sphingomonas sp. Root720]